ncbi:MULTISPECIES: FecR domain-containing protein [unclassified Acidovorax]|uniref:FecR family protein n=1 Tax=unclassified Acidovorax TaxID=2684926 RepID=UPI0028832861|nr:MULTISPECIES: FecR domain-containing protein [unclassified Acidovorax]
MQPLQDRASDIAEQAAAWIVLLDSDDAAERASAREGFAVWQAQSPRHAAAAARLQAFVSQVQQVGSAGGGDAQAARAALDATQEGSRLLRRRGRAAARVASAVALVVLLAVPSWLAVHSHPPAHLWADLRSSSGEWSRHTLSDGSVVTLSGVSALNWRMDDSSRVVELVRGSILVDVAKDGARPFVVQTPLGRIRALGTRFAVTYDDSGMTLEMLESRVAVQTPSQWQAGGRDALFVDAGQRVQVGPAGAGAVQAMDPGGVEQGWRQHQLVVDDRPLPEVLDQLARHHSGPLQFDRDALQGIRVSGVLPLDDTAQALRLLQRNFPQLRVRSVASRWVWVDRQPAS